MSKKTVLIIAEGCAGCKEAEKDLKKQNADLEILDVTKSLKAARIVRDLGIVKVPTIVTIEKSEFGTELCTLDEKNKTVKCTKPLDDEDF